MTLLCETVPFERRLIRALVAGGLVFGFLVLFFVRPADLPLPECAFHSFTGYSCMTCGMTRSLHAMVHGDLAGSAGYHLMGPVVFTGMLLCFMIFATEALSGRRSALRAAVKIRNRALMTVAIIWIVYWGARLSGYA